MSEARAQKRLAAILSADVVGYSRLMAADEERTLTRLKQLRKEVIDPTVAEHGGRLVKLMGDGALIEFTSVSEALECAVAVQEAVTAAALDLPEDQQILLRIGVNLGEVIVEGDDIYGDGVNIAARLESIAPPGGTVISKAAYDQVQGKVPLHFEDLGEQELKNIPQPIRTFRVVGPLEDRDGVPNRAGTTPRAAASSGKRFLLGGLAGLAVLLLALGGWWFNRSAPEERAETESLAETVAEPAEERPSIVVVPFANLSGNDEQSYFADGMTESIITDLSQVGGLLVIARNTSFTLKDQRIDLQAVSDDLGVRYVLEGSIQRSGERVRVNTNLVDARSGYQIWADKLDREFSDLFALQDEITGKIVKALKVQLTREERRQMAKSYTSNLEAYDLYLRAWQQYWEYNDQARELARSLLRQALAKDPEFARAMVLLAMTYTSQVGASLDESAQTLDRAQEIATRAASLDPQLPQVHWVLGLVGMFRKEYESAEESTLRAIELDPNFADAYALLCWILQYAGESERGLEAMEIALRLNPRAPFPYLSAEAETYFSLGQYGKAVEISSAALERNPTGQRLRLFMAASLAQVGEIEEAKWQVEELLLLEPSLRISALKDIAPYRDKEVLSRLEEGLRAAGLPD